jgi:hypothetical protein
MTDSFIVEDSMTMAYNVQKWLGEIHDSLIPANKRSVAFQMEIRAGSNLGRLK